MQIALVFALVVLALIGVRATWFSFAAQDPQSYAGTTPAFVVPKVFNGDLVSEGAIFGPTGRVVSRFVMQMKGEWTGQTGTLTESFQYDSGKSQQRQWHMVMGQDGRFTATADDIIGKAEGIQSGSAVRMRYRIRLPKDAGGHVLDVVDWLYLMPDGTIMNRSQMGRFGITLAELVATMRPVAHAGT